MGHRPRRQNRMGHPAGSGCDPEARERTPPGLWSVREPSRNHPAHPGAGGGCSPVTPAGSLALFGTSMGGVRPSWRPPGQPIGPRAGLPAQHGPGCGPGGKASPAPGAVTHPDGGAVPDGAAAERRRSWTERPRFLSRESPELDAIDTLARAPGLGWPRRSGRDRSSWRERGPAAAALARPHLSAPPWNYMGVSSA
jgi:hypothetical protein